MSCTDAISPSAPGSHHPIRDGLEALEGPGLRIGHNSLNFDHPALTKVYGVPVPPIGQIRDTYLLGRVLWPEIKEGDMGRWKAGKFPGNLIGRHSLEAWGHRLGEHKGDYTKWARDQGVKDVWASWCPEMHSYCEQDTVVTWKLWQRIKARKLDPRCVLLEHQTAQLCETMTNHGWPLNETGAGHLLATLQTERDAVEARLHKAFPPIETEVVFIPRASNSRYGYTKGVPVVRTETAPFNPAAPADVAARLTAKYGWEPTAFTEKTNEPQITETILEGLQYPEVPDLLAHMLTRKIMAFIANDKGDKGWINMARNGRIHARYETVGTVTGRNAHSKPNIGQVPKVAASKQGPIKGAPGGWGYECRDLFGVPEGWWLVGADQSGLELRCLAHYLQPFDKGRYVHLVCEGDVHTANQQAAGLPTRDNAKTFIYGFLYGAGPWKVGHIVAPQATDKEKETIGKKLILQFLKGSLGLKAFRDAVKERAKETGALTGLDGRPLTVRKPHAAVNTLLQSAGAILCKQWLVDIRDHLEGLGYIHSPNGDFVIQGWIHDEVQIAARTREIAEIVAKVCTEEATRAGRLVGFRCPTAGEAKIGRTWAETH